MIDLLLHAPLPAFLKVISWIVIVISTILCLTMVYDCIVYFRFRGAVPPVWERDDELNVAVGKALAGDTETESTPRPAYIRTYAIWIIGSFLLASVLVYRVSF